VDDGLWIRRFHSGPNPSRDEHACCDTGEPCASMAPKCIPDHDAVLPKCTTFAVHHALRVPCSSGEDKPTGYLHSAQVFKTSGSERSGFFVEIRSVPVTSSLLFPSDELSVARHRRDARNSLCVP